MLGRYVAAFIAALVVADGAFAAKRARSATSGGGSAHKAKTARSATGSNTARAGGTKRSASSKPGAQAEGSDTGAGQTGRAPSKGKSSGGGSGSASDLFFKTEMLRATLEDIAAGVRKFWNTNASRKNLDMPDNVALLKQDLKERGVATLDPWGNEVDFAGNGYITLKVKNLDRATCVYVKNTIKGGQYLTQANSIGSTDLSTEGGCQDRPDNVVSAYYKQNS